MTALDAITAHTPNAGIVSTVWIRTSAFRAAVIAGTVCGAVIGGIGGRIVMRIVALIDTSTDGTQTDFATVGEFNVGGTLTLIVIATLAGVIGSLIYVTIRRWLPFSGVARGVFFGLLMMFGPGLIAVSEIDLQIFEPAVPIFVMFVALIALYGVAVALLTDRLHAPGVSLPGRRVDAVARVAQCLVVAGIFATAILATYHVYDGAGTCLSADDMGKCAARPVDD